MLHMTDYSWFTNYVESDILWLDESLNWDESLNSVVADYVPLLSLTSSYFTNTHFATDWLAVSSFIEPVLMFEIVETFQPMILFLAFVVDLAIELNITYAMHGFLLHADYQDWVTTLIYHAPELILAIHDWNSLVFSSNTYAASAGAVFDVFQDTPSSKISEFVESFVLLLGYVWLSTLAINVLRLQPVARAVNPMLSRFYYYAASYAAESRLQMNAVIEASFLAFAFLLMMVMTFDDDREEIIEFFNLHLFYLFLLTFVLHAWKYSVHYLSFLDASRMSSSSVVFIAGQFLFDLLNLIGFALRFILLSKTLE